MATSKRFAQTTDAEIENKRLRLNAKNTLSANKKCGNILRDYLKENQMNCDFETFDAVRLNEVLCRFYVDLRKADGERYKSTSLEGIRSGLNRYLKSQPHNKPFDIVKDTEFNESNKNFKAELAEVKRLGLGDIQHHPVITEEDREKLYTSLYLSPATPTGLANKVRFDIRLYFCRRGNENMHKMTKSTFAIKTDPKTGERFVTKTQDELTKNHRETDRELVTSVMPESPGSVYCLVASYEKYVSHLHPSLDRLWQKPLDSYVIDNDVWYCNSPVGEKKLSSFMSSLSASCGLSQIYTNHSIRATGATLLTKNMYSSAQIMSVTGHKSVQSLTTYQRVDTEDKLKMGKTISENLVKSDQLALPSTSKLALPAPANNENLPPGTIVQDLVPVKPISQVQLSDQNNNHVPALQEYLQDINVQDLLCDFNENVFVPIQNRQSNTCMQSNPQIFLRKCDCNSKSYN